MEVASTLIGGGMMEHPRPMVEVEEALMEDPRLMVEVEQAQALMVTMRMLKRDTNPGVGTKETRERNGKDCRIWMID